MGEWEVVANCPRCASRGRVAELVYEPLSIHCPGCASLWPRRHRPPALCSDCGVNVSHWMRRGVSWCCGCMLARVPVRDPNP